MEDQLSMFCTDVENLMHTCLPEQEAQLPREQQLPDIIIIINVLQHIGTESQWKVLPKAKLH